MPGGESDRTCYHVATMLPEQHYDRAPDMLRHVRPAHEVAGELAGGSPFTPVLFAARAQRRMRRVLVRLAEIALGAPLLVENEYRELALLEPRARALLTDLIRRGLIENWRIGAAVPDQPYVVVCRLDLAPVTLPSGRVVRMHGSTGGGSGRTRNEALIPALAELLERHATAQWDAASLPYGTYAALQGRGAVDPSLFTFFSEEQYTEDDFVRHRVDVTTPLHWVSAFRFSDNVRVLLPAQLAYMFYEGEYVDEPVFWDTTSNGVAAGTSGTRAAYGAICEAIERDAFLIFWRNGLTPPRIDPETIPDPEVARLLSECARYRLSVHILDCTTDLQVPTFVGVLLDAYGSDPVFVTAATDFDVRTALRKLMYELLKFTHGSFAETDAEPPKARAITTMGQRQHYWRSIDWRSAIEFFVSGELRSYDEIVIPAVATASASEKLSALRRILGEKGYACYLIDLTTPEATRAGLRVVRAVCPDLVPIYFCEAKPHLGPARLRTTPVVLGYRTTPTQPEEDNPHPHPFI